MNKKFLAAFTVICLMICLVPSVGMLIAPTLTSSENRKMTGFPSLADEEGGINRDYFRQFENFYNEHAALRNQLIFADAKIQADLFGVSNVSGVIKGTDGWLYYSSTLGDYLGDNLMSGRELNNLAYNFALIQDYLMKNKASFVLTIPANKNTLYPDNMPYYDSCIVSEDHNMIRLVPYLDRYEVNYLDLYETFRAEDEVLYLKRDSHWNNKGALLAYNGIMSKLGLDHEDYSGTDPVIRHDECGDLNKMLYSFYGPVEDNYDYQLPGKYKYETGDGDVEASLIVTRSGSGKRTLLMFRDSFANTLIPFFSEHFGTACYSKGLPNLLERYVSEYQPGFVVIEKVERNIREYLDEPPVMTALETEAPQVFTVKDTSSTLDIAESGNDASYMKISGTVDESLIDTDTKILVQIGDICYRPYQTGTSGFVMYIPKEAFQKGVRYQVFAVNNGKYASVLSEVR